MDLINNFEYFRSIGILNIIRVIFSFVEGLDNGANKLNKDNSVLKCRILL